MKTIIRLLSLSLFSALLFQGCAGPRYPQPVYYPSTPSAAPDYSQPPRYNQAPPLATPEPTRPSGQGTSISADVSREANGQVSQGRLDLASATLERGLRIAPKDAMLWSQLADVKLQQGQYGQARSLATKSNSLAGGHRDVVRKNYWIIEEARRNEGAL